jgi:thymidylate synthase (FAD)
MSSSQSLVSLKHITNDAEYLITNLARVSNPSNQTNTETSSRLIRYLIQNEHWSPFEMVTMCVEINTQRDIAAQILRHRSFTFQEFSQRYADATQLGYTLPNLRAQDVSNRQSSIPTEYPKELYEQMTNYLDAGQNLYSYMLSIGVAKECARRILPLCQNTRMYMTGSVRSWLHYCDLRCGSGTQLEHQMIAEQVKAILKEQLPTVYEAMWGGEIIPPKPTLWERLKGKVMVWK